MHRVSHIWLSEHDIKEEIHQKYVRNKPWHCKIYLDFTKYIYSVHPLFCQLDGQPYPEEIRFLLSTNSQTPLMLRTHKQSYFQNKITATHIKSALHTHTHTWHVAVGDIIYINIQWRHDCWGLVLTKPEYLFSWQRNQWQNRRKIIIANIAF